MLGNYIFVITCVINLILVTLKWITKGRENGIKTERVNSTEH